jgi:hypothetical protein
LQLQVKAQTIVENPSTTKPWDVELLVTKAFNNKGQKQGDKNKLGGWSGWPFKQFSSLQELKNTLPKASVFKIFNQLVAKH